MKSSRGMVVSLLMAAALVVTVPEAGAQMARISATVVDTDGKPLADVNITVTTPDSERFELVKVTNKKGKATLSFNNMAWRYQIRLEKEGFQTRIEALPLTAGGTVRREWVLEPGAPATTDAAGPGAGGSKAVRIYNEGVEAQRQGDLALAEEKFRRAAELNSELAAPHTALAAVAGVSGDWETVAAEAELALAIDPEDVRAMQLRFDAYRNLGNQAMADEAAKALRTVGDIESAAARIFNEGVDAYQAGDVATAQSKFRQVIELSPEMVPPYVALAQISLSQDSGAEALAMAQSALEREPDNQRALMIAYDGARMTNDPETAQEVLERLVGVDPQWVTTTLFEHAVKLFNDNQASAAALELQYVVKADPQMARAQFLLGMSLFNSGRPDEGRVHLERFIELAPDDPDVEIARGLLSYQQ